MAEAVSVSPAPQPTGAIYNLPAPTKLLNLSEKFSYPVLKGLRFNPKNPLNIEFLVDTANKEDVTKEEANRLIKYFLAGLTLPQEELWVNLSPYEGERVASDNLALTDLGKDLLGQDYCLKQLVSSLTYPETELGKRYWNEVIAKTNSNGLNRQNRLNGINGSINTYNKVWVMPQKSVVYEKGDTAFVLEASLKTMHERDYTAAQRGQSKDEGRRMKDEKEKADEIASNVFKEVILPQVNQEVNQGKSFATLRQIYHSLILAVWFRKKFQNTFYKYYIDQSKIAGIDLNDKNVKDKIFNLYVQAYKGGVYNCIKREQDSATKHPVRRRYTSGGTIFTPKAFNLEVRPNLPPRFTIADICEGHGVKVISSEVIVSGRAGSPATGQNAKLSVGRRTSVPSGHSDAGRKERVVASPAVEPRTEPSGQNSVFIKGELHRKIFGHLFDAVLPGDLNISDPEVNALLRHIVHYDTSLHRGEDGVEPFDAIYGYYKKAYEKKKKEEDKDMAALPKGFPLLEESIVVSTGKQQGLGADAASYGKGMVEAVEGAIDAIAVAGEDKSPYDATILDLFSLIDKEVEKLSHTPSEATEARKIADVERKLRLLRSARSELEAAPKGQFPLLNLTIETITTINSVKTTRPVVRRLLLTYAFYHNTGLSKLLEYFRGRRGKELTHETISKLIELVDGFPSEGISNDQQRARALFKPIDAKALRDESERIKAGGFTRRIKIVPTRGWLAEFIGYFSDECWTRTNHTMEDNDNMVALVLVDADTNDLLGGTLLIIGNAIAGTNEPVLIDRGFSPRKEVTESIVTEDLMRQVLDYEEKIARSLGATKVLVPMRDESDPGLGSNNPDILDFYKRMFSNQPRVDLRDVNRFNGHDITHGRCAVARDVAPLGKKAESSSAASPVRTFTLPKSDKPLTLSQRAVRSMLSIEGDLHDKNWYIRKAAAQALGLFYSELIRRGEEVNLTLLKNRLNDWDDNVRQAAIESLGLIYSEMVRQGKEVDLTDLQRKYTSVYSSVESPKTRQNAIKALGLVYTEMARKGKEIFREIEAFKGLLVGEMNADMRLALIDALCLVYTELAGQPGREAFLASEIKSKLSDLSDSNYSIRRDAAQVLGAIYTALARNGKRADLTELKDALDVERNWVVRQAMVGALGMACAALARRAEKVPPEIVEALKIQLTDRFDPVSQAAVKALGIFYTEMAGQPEEEAFLLREIGYFREKLTDQDSGMSRVAAQILGTVCSELARHAKKVPPEIVEAFKSKLSDEDGWVRLAVVEALGLIYTVLARQGEEVSPEIVEIFKSKLNDPNWDVIKAAAQALGLVGSELVRQPGIAKGIAEALKSTLTYAELDLCRVGANALGLIYAAMFRQNNMSLDELRSRLTAAAEDWAVCLAAAKALGLAYAGMDQQEKEATRDALRSVVNGNHDVVQAAAQALVLVYSDELARQGMNAGEDYKKYKLWSKSNLPYEPKVVEWYLTEEDSRAALEEIMRDAAAAVDDDAGFNYDDEASVWYAYAGIRVAGINMTLDELKERLAKFKEYDAKYPGSWQKMFAKKRALPGFEVSEEGVTVLDATSVNSVVIDEHARQLREIKKGIDDLSLIAKVFGPGHKFSSVKGIYYEMQRRKAVTEGRLLGGGRFHIEYPSTDDMEQYFRDNRKEFYKTVFLLAEKLARGNRGDNVIEAACFGLMRDLIVADVLSDEALASDLDSTDIERLTAALINFEGYKKHLPDSLGIKAEKIKAVSKLLEDLSRPALVSVQRAGNTNYRFVGQGFLAAFRGRAGMIDCSFFMDTDKGFPFTRTMHEDTQYYFVYKGKELKGYIGLMVGVTDKGERVLTIDTLNSPSLDGGKLLMNVFRGLSVTARKLDCIGIALPAEIGGSFNFSNEITIPKMTVYQQGKTISVVPLHRDSWQTFTDIGFGPDKYNSMDMSDKFVLLDVKGEGVREEERRAAASPLGGKAERQSAASPLSSTGSSAERSGASPEGTGSTPLGGIDVTGKSFNLQTSGPGMDAALADSRLNPHFNRLQFVITFMKDVSAKETIDELAAKAWK
jgi:HEAT repeat protein